MGETNENAYQRVCCFSYVVDKTVLKNNFLI